MADSHPSTSQQDGSRSVKYKTFKKRKGTTNKGGEYENLNIAHLILNLLKNKNYDSYYISSNDEEYGDFDDVVLETMTLNQIKTLYAIQLKHSNNKITLNKNQLTKSNGDFSIQKYANNFKQIKNHNLDELRVILFTNLKFDISDDNTVITLNDNGNFDIRIKEVTIEQENLLNTSDNKGRSYKFEIVENEATSRNMKKAEEYRIFFEKFYLYTNQRSAYKIEKNIINKFQILFGCDETIAREYLRFVSEWGSLAGEKEKLNNETATQAIAKLLLSPFVINFSFSGESVNKNTKLLRNVVSKFDVTLLDEENCDIIKKMWQDLGSNLKNCKKTTQIVNRYQFFNRDVTKLSEKEKTLLLWLMDECPIIVFGNKITKIAIELCPRKTYILIGNGDTKKIQDCQVLQNLSDLKKKLDEKVYNEILENFKCSLQGKQQITLRELIDGCDNLLECITVNKLVEMLNGSFRFGEYREQLPIPHVERFITKNVIDFKGIDDIMKDRGSQNLIIISCFGRLDQNKNNFNNFNLIKIEDYLKNAEIYSNNSLMPSSFHKFRENSKKCIYVSQNECSDFEFQQICKKNPSKNCHYLQVIEDEQFEWIETKGDINDLLKQRKHEHFVKEIDLSSYKNGNPKINIICDDPGMGKSILMKSLKNNYLPTFWVILITPTDVSTFIEEKNEREEFVDYIINKKCGKIAVLVKNLNISGRVTYFWDGLDEVRQDYLKVVYRTVEKLAEKHNTQWITSRRHLQSNLENHFSVLSRRIKQFDDQQQKDYIRKRLSGLECDINETIQKIEQCLKAAKFNDVLGIPLQISMLTELFLQNSEKHENLFNGLFSLVELYEHFVEEKISIFFKEKLKLFNENEYFKRIYEREKKNEIKCCQHLALITVFEPEILNDLEIELNGRNIESSCIEDIIIKVHDESPHFIHNSYGEYFAALYLFERCTNMKNLQKYIFKEHFRNVRFLFDLMMAKNHPAHIGVLYKNPSIVKKYLQDPAEKDDGGRTLLHLACAWGNTYPLLNYEKNGGTFLIEEEEVSSIKEESSEYRSIFEFLTEKNVPDEHDEIFNMPPVDYADKSLSLYPIIKLSESQNIDFTAFENFKDIFRILWYCAKFDYSGIFEVIENIAEMPTQTKKFGRTILHIAASFNAIEFLKAYLKHKNNLNVNDVDFLGLTPLHIACRKGHCEIVDQLIKNKADVNATDEDGFTPLYFACQEGHCQIVDQLIRNKADVNFGKNNFTAPLYIASVQGHFEVVEQLIKNKADVNTTDEDGFNPLYFACGEGNCEVVDQLIRNKADVNVTNKDGCTPLFIACEKGHLEIVDKLIRNNADINRANTDGFTPIYIARLRNHQKIFELLINFYNEANASDKLKHTPLYFASLNGNYDMVDHLIKSGSNVNEVDELGFTPLHIACHYGHGNVIDLLIGAHADVNIADKYGFTPLHATCLNGNLDLVETLIKNSADVNAVDKCGVTPFYLACHIGHLSMVKYLISLNAHINYPDNHGVTPIQTAVYREHLSVVKTLIDHNVNMNSIDNDGDTPLHEACFNRNCNITELLIKSGANSNIKNNNGFTPLEIARRRGYFDLIDLLENSASPALETSED